MKSFVVIGCGRFGSSIAKTLYGLNYEVMAIDSREEAVKEVSDYVTFGVEADVMDESVLHDLGISNFDVAIVAIGSDLESSVMATLIAKELGVKTVIAKAQSEFHSKILYKIGADKVVFPERDMGVKLAHNLASKNILDYIELSPEYSILEMETLGEWVGKSLKDLDLSNKYSLSIMAIKTGKSVRVAPKAKDIIQKGDILVIIGDTNKLNEIEKKMED